VEWGKNPAATEAAAMGDWRGTGGGARSGSN